MRRARTYAGVVAVLLTAAASARSTAQKSAVWCSGLPLTKKVGNRSGTAQMSTIQWFRPWEPHHFRPGVPYVPGSCFSCGDALAALRFGRCWRCSLAWRLAVRLPVPADLAVVLDDVKVLT